MKYAIRLPANDSLMRDIEEVLTGHWGDPRRNRGRSTRAFCIRRPVGRSRRVVAKVEFHAGELFPRVGFSNSG